MKKEVEKLLKNKFDFKKRLNYYSRIWWTHEIKFKVHIIVTKYDAYIKIRSIGVDDEEKREQLYDYLKEQIREEYFK